MQCCDIKNNNNVNLDLLKKSIEAIILEEKFVTYEVKEVPISTDGGNYLGDLFEIKIKGKTEDGEKQLDIFAKKIIAPDGNAIFTVNEIYRKEHMFYTEIVKKFNAFQEKANIPIEEKLKLAKSYNDNNSEVILLENLALQGFVSQDRLKVLPLEFVEISVQALAKFHSLSFVLQAKEPKYYDLNIKPLRYLDFNDGWKSFFQRICRVSTRALDDVQKKKIADLVPTFMKKYEQYFTDTESTLCCLCHGDYRGANVMTKTVDGKISQLVPVDFQLLHYACPLLDFFYLLYNGTDSDFRKKHLTHLKDLYYATLTKFLIYFDMDVENVYSRKSFEVDFKEKIDYGLIVFLAYAPMFYAYGGNIPDMSGEFENMDDIKPNEIVDERMRGIYDEFVELGFIV